MPGGEAEIDQLPRAALDIFRRGAVVEYEEGVGPRKEVAGHSQLGLDLVLQAGNDKDVRVAVHEALVCLVLDKGGAEEHDVVKLALNGPRSWLRRYCVLPELVGPTIKALKGSFLGSIYTSVWLMCWRGGRLGEESLYLPEGYYPRVSGRS